MKRTLRIAACLALSGMLGYAFGQTQRAKVGVTADIATYTVTGARLSGIATKRLSFVNLRYNDTVVPCVVVDTNVSALSNDNVGGASVSCGWTPEAIQAIGAVGK